MAKHLFLTGEKGVGKSTLIKGLLAQYHGSLGGFFTVKSASAVPGRISVHLLRADRRERPALENLLFSCGEPAGAAVADRFDRLGRAALAAGTSADLLVMDELGPHEADARSFCRAALQALDGNIPILGVLQRADVPFLAQIAAHPQVRLVEVTVENRDELARTLCLPTAKEVCHKDPLFSEF